jgi:alpha-galactosidase
MRPLPGGGTEMTFDESKTQLGMWAMMASPLIIGSDPRTLPAEMVSALRNPEIVAVDQDPLVRQGVKVADPSGTTQVWGKTLAGAGKRAVALLNRGDSAAQITVGFAAVALGGTVEVRDLWARSGAGTFTGSYTTTVAAHGVAMLGLTGTDQVTGTDLGQRGTDGPAVAGGETFARSSSGELQAYADGKWRDLGKRVVGQPAAYASAGGRIDLFVRGADGQAWHGVLNGHRVDWTALGGHLADAPTAAFTSPSSWTVFARRADGQLESRGPRGGWTSLGAPVEPAADGFNGRPSASVDGSGAVHVAVRARTDEIWERVRANGVWSRWQNLGGTLNGSPTLVAASGRIYLFAVAADNRLWQRNFVDGAWGGWFQRPEFAAFEIQGAIGGEASATGGASVVLRGVDGHVHSTGL